MSQDSQSPRSARNRGVEWLKRVVCLALIAVGVYVIWRLGGELYTQLRLLQQEWAKARDHFPVGYVGINSELPLHRPPSCIRREKGRVLLWAGTGAPGQPIWFDVTGTDLPWKQFRFAFGRDRIRTIDVPIYESPQGEIARRILPERPMLGVVINGIVRAYPLRVMEKVELVNDTFGDRPLAVTYCPPPLKPRLERAAVYERSLDGVPISFGHSGYCYLDSFVLYDRATDSLWWPTERGLTAITGPLAGRVLKKVCTPETVAWKQWRRRHPDTQVLVGADRSQGIPYPPRRKLGTAAL